MRRGGYVLRKKRLRKKFMKRRSSLINMFFVAFGECCDVIKIERRRSSSIANPQKFPLDNASAKVYSMNRN